MSKELDRAGIPNAFITTLVPLAQSVGANRIVAGAGVTNPVGNPRLPAAEEKEFRRRLVRKALEALQVEVRDQLIVQ